MNYKLGELLELVTEQNSNLEYGLEDIVGVTIEKEMIPTIANLKETALDNFVIVRPHDFIYNPRTHGKKIGLGYNKTDKCYISTWNNNTFRVKKDKEDTILPDYLYLYFKREIWDKEACFHAWGSSTVVLSWDSFCEMDIDIPTLEEQQKIVRQYKTITDRIEVLEKINEKLEQLLMVMFTNLFDTDDLQNITLDKLSGIKTESIDPCKIKSEHVWHYSIPAFDEIKLPVLDETENILSNKYKVPKKSVLVSKLNPQTKRIWRSIDTYENAICSTEFIVFTPYKKNYHYFLYPLFNTDDFTDFMISNATGTTNSRIRIKPKLALDYTFNCPSDESISEFCDKVQPIYEIIDKNIAEINEIKKLMLHIKAKTC